MDHSMPTGDLGDGVGYSALLDAVEEARSKAAAFRRCDLHVHSWDSGDYSRRSDKVPEEELPPAGTPPRNADDWLEEVAAEHGDVDLIAVTDHNHCRVACDLAERGLPGILILPGMEISLAMHEIRDWEKIHLLLICPPGTAHEEIERRLFGPFGAHQWPSRHDDRDDATTLSGVVLSELLIRIRELGWVGIVAHANSDRGCRQVLLANDVKRLELRTRLKNLTEHCRANPDDAEASAKLEEIQHRCHGHEDRLQEAYLSYLAENGVAAVEISAPEDRLHYEGIHCTDLDIDPIACLISSDAHHPVDIGIDAQITYLKMGELSFDGLIAALRDPETRVRYDGDICGAGYPRILGIQFTSHEDDNRHVPFLNGQVVGFSDNLSCLIGGRGSGKSTVVDSLRFALMEEVIGSEKQLQQDVHTRWAHTLANGTVRLLYRENGQTYVLVRHLPANAAQWDEATGSPSDLRPDGISATRVHDLSGEQVTFDWDNREGRFGVQLFGWSEIEHLATDRRSQLQRMVDDFIEDMDGLRGLRDDARDEIAVNTGMLTETRRTLWRLRSDVEPLSFKEQALSQFEGPEMTLVFKRLDYLRHAKRTVSSHRKRLADMKTKVWAALNVEGEGAVSPEDLQGSICLGELLDEESPISEERVEELAEALREVWEGLTSLRTGMTAALQILANAEAELDAAEKQADAELLSAARQAFSDELAVGDVTESDLVEQIAQRDELARDVQALREKKQQLDEAEEEYRNGLMIRREKRRLLSEAQSAITERREAKATELTSALEHLRKRVEVHVEILPLTDKESFSRAIAALIEGCRIGHYKNDNWSDRWARSLTPGQFVDAILCRTPASLTLPADDQSPSIEQHHAEQMINYLHPDEAEDCQTAVERLRRLLELEEALLDDLPKISLDGEPIEALSPGQRCSALLPLVLLQGKRPLVIDQPEDNLDNEMVFQVVVDVLRKLKEKRQVIVATHNPNIPVSGDAEQIVVMRGLSKCLGQVLHQASIDDEATVRSVTEIMEGGREAFELRAQKYGYREFSLRE